MPSPAILATFGVFVEVDFLDEPAREQLEASMRAGKQELAEVVDESGERRRDASNRSTRNVQVAADVLEGTRERVAALRPRLQEHFAIELSGMQGPEFLTYQAGDFFQMHRDGGDESSESQPVAGRKLSVITFVNGEKAEGGASGGYEGGSLVLYGLMGDDERSQAVGFPINPDGGELIAFRSSMLHEVQPVISGERHTTVCWFT